MPSREWDVRVLYMYVLRDLMEMLRKVSYQPTKQTELSVLRTLISDTKTGLQSE